MDFKKLLRHTCLSLLLALATSLQFAKQTVLKGSHLLPIPFRLVIANTMKHLTRLRQAIIVGKPSHLFGSEQSVNKNVAIQYAQTSLPTVILPRVGPIKRSSVLALWAETIRGRTIDETFFAAPQQNAAKAAETPLATSNMKENLQVSENDSEVSKEHNSTSGTASKDSFPDVEKMAMHGQTSSSPSHAQMLDKTSTIVSIREWLSIESLEALCMEDSVAAGQPICPDSFGEFASILNELAKTCEAGPDNRNHSEHGDATPQTEKDTPAPLGTSVKIPISEAEAGTLLDITLPLEELHAPPPPSPVLRSTVSAPPSFYVNTLADVTADSQEHLSEVTEAEIEHQNASLVTSDESAQQASPVISPSSTCSSQLLECYSRSYINMAEINSPVPCSTVAVPASLWTLRELVGPYNRYNGYDELREDYESESGDLEDDDDDDDSSEILSDGFDINLLTSRLSSSLRLGDDEFDSEGDTAPPSYSSDCESRLKEPFLLPASTSYTGSMSALVPSPFALPPVELADRPHDALLWAPHDASLIRGCVSEVDVTACVSPGRIEKAVQTDPVVGLSRSSSWPSHEPSTAEVVPDPDAVCDMDVVIDDDKNAQPFALHAPPSPSSDSQDPDWESDDCMEGVEYAPSITCYACMLAFAPPNWALRGNSSMSDYFDIDDDDDNDFFGQYRTNHTCMEDFDDNVNMIENPSVDALAFLMAVNIRSSQHGNCPIVLENQSQHLDQGWKSLCSSSQNAGMRRASYHSPWSQPMPMEVD